MGERIKGITIQLNGDTKGLNKALESTNKNIRGTQSQLKDVEKLLKLDPKNTELLGQKQRLLADQISNTKEKLEKLKQAESQVQEQMKEGKASQDQYDALRREIIQTESSLGKLESSAADTEQAMKEATEGAASGLEEVQEEAKGAEEALEDVGDAAGDIEDNSSSFGDVFKAGLAVSGISKVVDALKEASEQTKEYRNDISKLNVAFETNGSTVETAKKTYDDLQSILGDSGQAVEAANHLANLTSNEQELAAWSNICAGVYGVFGNSLPIEGLTEASNETAKTGVVTGNLADALNWVGIAEDEFQAKLDACSDESSRATLITNTLSSAYDEAGRSFKETNKDIIESNRASGKLQDAMARLGDKVEPILTFMVNASAKLLNIMTEARPVVVGLVVAFAANKIVKFASALDLATVKQKLFNAAANANPYVLLASLIATIITEIVMLVDALGDAEEATDDMTEAEKKAAKEAKRLEEEAYRAAQNVGKEVANSSRYAAEQTEAAVDAISGKVSEMLDAFNEVRENRIKSMDEDSSYFEHIEKLKDELLDLVDANGQVAESDRGRVSFILNELSNATGEEYSMVDGLIENYGELKSSIDAVIASKRINTLLDAYEPEYQQALQSEATLAEDVGVKYNDAVAKKKAYQDLDKFYADKVAQGFELDPNAYVELENARIAAQDAETAYYDAVLAYGEVEETIVRYETAMGEALEGNYAEAEKVLTDTTGLLSEEEQAYMDVLRGQIDFTKGWLDETKEAMKTGGAGSAEQYQLAMKDYFAASEERNGAVREALGFGEDVADGMAYGMENEKGFVYDTVRDMVNGIIKTARETADSHSPSRKMVDFGEDLGAGVPIGVRKKLAAIKASGQEIYDSLVTGLHYEYPMENIEKIVRSNYDNRSSSIGEINVYVDGADAGDPDQLAEHIAETLNLKILNRKAALS